jgi:hypothetical protein
MEPESFEVTLETANLMCAIAEKTGHRSGDNDVDAGIHCPRHGGQMVPEVETLFIYPGFPLVA